MPVILACWLTNAPKGGGPPKWHACVRIDGPTYRQLKAFFVERACHRSLDNVAAEFARVPYARYAPVRRQMLTILRAVNDKRAEMGFGPVPHSALLLRRHVVKPFEAPSAEEYESLSKPGKRRPSVRGSHPALGM